MGDTHITGRHIGGGTHITSDMCTGIHISRGYTYHCDSGSRMAFRLRMRCWCGGNVQGVCPSFILALLISVFFAIFHMEAPENT